MVDKEKIKEIISQAIKQGPFRNDIKKVSLFGSFLKGTQKEDSDIDLLVEFAPTARIGFFKFVDIQNSFEKKLSNKIDLLTSEAISKHFRAEVLKQAETIYER
ncbi:MAG: nucleotidyltransferase family protein [Candidatus Margulisiibacteriota bacterium]